MGLRPKPVAMHKGKLHWIDHDEVTLTSFLWNFPANVGKETPALTIVAEIETLHSCAFPGFFKPSIQEVWNQIPELFKDIDLHAFETNLISNDLNECLTEDQSSHIARTRFYKVK
ncbi:hypothetical protein LCGC14_0196040 [marine sediment metagenome]|uniref:Uncharacterized protein n=1 Tax=marine sediment metagenome TaxID=412755 RepID=A0A0F9X4M8_9ZZZZ